MAQIIQLDFNKTNSASGVIDIATVQQSCRKLKAGLIAPATEEVHTDLAVEHAAEPIKSMDDIIRISQFLIGQKRFRDNMLFIVGINFGLRISDLRSLRFTHIINDDCTFRDRFPILEKKTRNTRKHQRNRYRRCHGLSALEAKVDGKAVPDHAGRARNGKPGRPAEPRTEKHRDDALEKIA